MQIIIVIGILFLTLSGDSQCSRIVKRRFADERNKTNESFHVNVSAGYGIETESNNSTNPPTKHYFQERSIRKEVNNVSTPLNHHDQISQPSVITPTLSTYQVRENHLQEKSFRTPSSGKYNFQQPQIQSTGRPTFHEIQNVVNNLEHDRPGGISAYGRPPKGSTIVEVVRVPAIYELHLQAGNNHDAQRFVTLNPWVNKLNGWMQDTRMTNGYQYRPSQPPPKAKPLQYSTIQNEGQSYNTGGFSFGGDSNYNFAHQTSGQSYQEPKLSQLLQNLKLSIMSQEQQPYIQQSHEIYQQPQEISYQPQTHESHEVLHQPTHIQQSHEISYQPQTHESHEVLHQPTHIQQSHEISYQPQTHESHEVLHQPTHIQQSHEISHQQQFMQTEPSDEIFGQQFFMNSPQKTQEISYVRSKGNHQYHSHGFDEETPSSLRTSTKQTNHYRGGNLRNNRYHSYSQRHYQQHHHQQPLSAESYKKVRQEVMTPKHNNQWDYSHEINHDYYKKPQALHEVPAPVLNKYQANPNFWPKIKPTPLSSTWMNNVEVQENQISLIPGPLDNLKLDLIKSTPYQEFPQGLSGYSKGHVESVPNDFYQDESSSLAEDQQQHLPADYSNININVGSYLDQDLTKQNAEILTHEKDSSNAYSQPQIYFNNHEIDATQPTKPQSEGDDVKAGQEIFAQHIAPEVNYLLVKGEPTSATLMQTTEEIPKNLNYAPKFESMKLNQGKMKKMVNYPRPFKNNNNRRNLRPMDYIIFIKERTLD